MKIRVNGLTIKSDIEQRYFIKKLLICAIVALLYGATFFLGEELLNGESAFAYFTYWKSFAYFGIHSMIKGVVPFVVLFLIWTIFDVFRKKSNCEDQTQSRCEQWVMIAGLVLMSLPCYFAYDHGIISYDAGENIAEAAGVAPKSNFQPYAHTLVWGVFYKLEQLTHVQGMAIAMYSISQCLFIIVICVYLIHQLTRILGIHRWTRWIMWGFYAFCPVLTLFSIVLTKDIYFAGFFIIFSLQHLTYLENGNNGNAREIALVAMSGLLASLFRNNFVYVVGAMFLLDLLAALTRHNKRYGILCMGCLLGAVLTVVITGPVYQMMGVATSPKKESLSVPIVQMSAVYPQLTAII